MLILTQKILDKIFFIRNEKVMFDNDLAELYSVKTKALNQAVKRNADRFPEDFMFQLTEKEYESLRSQIVTSKERGGRRTLPFVFTEQGVAMLSSVLHSEIAVNVNIQIIRVFTQMRKAFLTQKNVLLKLEHLEKKILKQDEHNKKVEREIQAIFQALKRLLDAPAPPRKRSAIKSRNKKSKFSSEAHFSI